jgi:hypothetical protein
MFDIRIQQDEIGPVFDNPPRQQQSAGDDAPSHSDFPGGSLTVDRSGIRKQSHLFKIRLSIVRKRRCDQAHKFGPCFFQSFSLMKSIFSNAADSGRRKG